MVYSLFFCSCQKQDLVYSCDPELNRWAMDNIDQIAGMTRSDVLSFRYDTDRQRAILAASTPEQKIALWKGKIQDVLTLEGSVQERAHIEALLSMIETHPHFFNLNESKKNEDKIDLLS